MEFADGLDLPVNAQTGDIAIAVIEPYRLAGAHDMADHAGVARHGLVFQLGRADAADGDELQMIVAFGHDDGHTFGVEQRRHLLHDARQHIVEPQA